VVVESEAELSFDVSVPGGTTSEPFGPTWADLPTTGIAALVPAQE
jgi:hypothetical protein